ncbi:MAG: DUF4261 domain-containing protein [Clostridia bacterium]|nr:DUF4261 domain-containing protein [Clostridia bacterium]
MSDKILKLYTGDDDNQNALSEEFAERDEMLRMITEMVESDKISPELKEQLQKIEQIISDDETMKELIDTVEDGEEPLEILQEFEKLTELLDEEITDDMVDEGEFEAYIPLSKEIDDNEIFFQNVIKTLQEEWNIKVSLNSRRNKKRNDNELYITKGKNTVEIHIEKNIIPKELLDMSKEMNYMLSDEQKKKRKRYKATVVVLASEEYSDVLELAKIFVKVVYACAKQKNVTGVIQNSVMYETDYYLNMAEVMKKDILPMANLLWVHIVEGEYPGTVCAWTSGMELFGREEIEVENSIKSAYDIINFIMSVANYILSEDVDIEDGEKIEMASETFEVTYDDSRFKSDDITMQIDYYRYME